MWDQRYSVEEYIYGKEPNEFLAESVGKIPKGKVLCVAEGEGRNAVFLAQQGYNVLAVDSSAVGLEKARKLAQEKGVEIQTLICDLAELKIEPESWDGVVSIFAHVPPMVRKELHTNITKGLRSGGVLVLEAYRPKQLQYKTGGPPVEELMMTLDALQQELQGLHIDYGMELDRDIVEGAFHTGKGAVVQIIATKP
ncbi:MAG: class I SAM-dependent methyltransferase [Gammaproteobacteria bacterium]|nr:class I SAM-dependent methyltransferase [Gammaproteobacteria bacterium]MDH5800522.1 class I SAM-dependent methyltransferase [Gammaproteobacteria bacterium]